SDGECFCGVERLHGFSPKWWWWVMAAAEGRDGLVIVAADLAEEPPQFGGFRCRERHTGDELAGNGDGLGTQGCTVVGQVDPDDAFVAVRAASGDPACGLQPLQQRRQGPAVQTEPPPQGRHGLPVVFP